MKSSLSRLALLAAATASVVQAHPGHDGHEGGDFSWDFSHLSSHPVATAGCLLVVGVALWVGARHRRTRRDSSAS